MALHRLRFLDYAPVGVATSCLHPSGGWLAVAREDGDVELWRTASGRDAWVEVITLSGSGKLGIQSVWWVSCHSTRHAGRGLDGARLFIASLNGGVYEAEWLAGCVVPLFEPGGGAVWSMAAWGAVSASRGTSRGTGVSGGTVLTNIVAVGCEDGAVRLFDVPFEVEAAPVLSSVAAAGGTPPGISEDAAPRLLAVCSGTEGRVLSLAWHPALPVLYAGTANGKVRGWDLSPVAATAVAGKSRSHAHDDGDGEGGDSNAVDDGTTGVADPADALAATLGLTFGGGVGGGGKVPKRAGGKGKDGKPADSKIAALVSPVPVGRVAGPLPLVHFSADTASRDPSAVWALAVTRCGPITGCLGG